MERNLEELWIKIRDNVYSISNEYVVIVGDSIRYLDANLVEYAKETIN